MSRIGNKPVDLPSGVSLEIDGSVLKITGPKGTLEESFDSDIEIKQEEGKVVFNRPTEQKRHKALHGLYRSLVNNMVIGVTEGYKKELELVGVGYKAAVQSNVLELSLGYSHSIFFQIPSEVKVEAKNEKGKNPIVILESIDKQLVGQVAAKLRTLRKIEPYKGKGVRFVGEQIRRKAGKAAAK